MKIKNIMKNIIATIIRYLFDAIFFILIPPLFIYSWFRFNFKKTLKLRPKIIISPLGEPLPFYAIKAIRSAGYKADNVAFDCPAYFRPISFDLILADHFWLRILNYLSDYTLVFCWAVLKYDIFESSFSGGLLFSSHLRKIEFPILKILMKTITVYGHGADCKILSDIRKQGFKYNTAMDRTEATESFTEKVIRANVARAQKYASVLIIGGDLIHLGQKGVMLPLATDLSLWKYAPTNKHRFIKIGRAHV
jgi:hypothetical protein